MAKKNFLFVMRREPHGGIFVQEALDIILTIAAFDQRVSLLFLDDGVYQLKKGQSPAGAGLKDVAPIFGALPIYDVQAFYAEEESLIERGLNTNQLILPVILISRAEVPLLLQRHDVILNG
ncbi:MAG: sulfurtransferase complex subunit TusC [Pseudomonadota bacterium]